MCEPLPYGVSHVAFFKRKNKTKDAERANQMSGFGITEEEIYNLLSLPQELRKRCLCIYPIGSRVFGTQEPGKSDFDFFMVRSPWFC
jgi:hypothetical protein